MSKSISSQQQELTVISTLQFYILKRRCTWYSATYCNITPCQYGPRNHFGWPGQLLSNSIYSLTLSSLTPNLTQPSSMTWFAHYCINPQKWHHSDHDHFIVGIRHFFSNFQTISKHFNNLEEMFILI